MSTKMAPLPKEPSLPCAERAESVISVRPETQVISSHAISNPEAPGALTEILLSHMLLLCFITSVCIYNLHKYKNK